MERNITDQHFIRQMAQQWQLFHNFQHCVYFHNGY